jgi:hypothetical protein
MKGLLLLTSFSTFFALSAVALAQTESDESRALELFNRGVKQREAGGCDETPARDVNRCKEAMDSFKRAYALSPSALGALRNLAYVEKSLGMTASAARDFRELARKAPQDPRPERRLWAGFASKEADALEAVVPHLAVQVRAAASEVTVTLDGAPLPESVWGPALEVDPGEHVVRAERSGRAAFISSVTVANSQQRTNIVEWTAVAPTDPTPSAAVGTAAAASNDRRPAPESSRPFPTGPVVVGGVGLVVAGVGLTLGAVAKSKRDECDAATKLCPPGVLSAAHDFATTSTIVTGVGAAGVAAGIVWYLLRPSPSSTRPQTRVWVVPTVGPGVAQAAVAGRF